MRYTIPIKTTPKRPNAKEEVRLFTMNDDQAELFSMVVASVAKNEKVPLANAAAYIEKVVAQLFDGKNPPENANPVFLRMRRAFPILRPRDIKKLPRAGCPSGTIKAMVLQVNVPTTITNEEGVEKVDVKRTILIKFDEDQSRFHRDAIDEVMDRDGCSKDDAWLFVNQMIGLLMAGGTLKEKNTDEMILMRAVNLFPHVSLDEISKYPEATEEDVRRWSFTMDRVH